MAFAPKLDLFSGTVQIDHDLVDASLIFGIFAGDSLSGGPLTAPTAFSTL